MRRLFALYVLLSSTASASAAVLDIDSGAVAAVQFGALFREGA